MTSFDIGGGWLVSDLQEAEVGVHPVDPDKGRFSGTHHISFYCDAIQQVVDALSANGVECAGGIRNTGWGFAVRIPVPGRFEIDLYERRYQNSYPITTAGPPQDVEKWVESVRQWLLEIPETQAATRAAPGQWSAKEVLGHLIDSAANNHRRFVEAQLKDDLIFPGTTRSDG